MKLSFSFILCTGLLFLAISWSHAQDPLLEAYYDGRFTEVIHYADRSITAGDTTSHPHLLKALALIQLGKNGEAIVTLKEAQVQFPREHRFRAMLAGQYFETGAYTRADSLYEAMAAEDSADIVSLIRLAEIASFRQQYRESLLRLNRVLQLDSTHLKGWMMKGEILTRMQDSTAIECYHHLLRYYPGNQQAAYALGNLYIQFGHPENAIPVAQEILQQDSLNIKFLKLEGFAWYRSGSPGKALPLLERALAAGDSTAFTFKYLGISRYLIMDFPGAIPPLEMALVKDSLDADIHFFIGASLATTTRKEEAMRHLDRALALMNPDPAAVAKIYTEQGNLMRLDMQYDRAYDLYRRSWEADSTQTLSLYYMASILDNSLHRSQEALVDYQRFLEQLDQLPESGRTNNQIPTIRDIVEDRIVQLREELFLKDEQ